LVTWIGHSSVLLQLGTLNILTDPMWSERASPVRRVGPRRLMTPGVDFDALPPIDVVLLSHNHYDHLDAATVRRMAQRFPETEWLCPMGLAGLLRRFGVRRVAERDWWQTVDTPVFMATCTPAQHFSARGLRDRNMTLWCSWTIQAGDARIYFSGDTALHPDFETIGAYEPRWFMRRVHCNPEDAVAAYRALTSRSGAAPPCVALHWGTFRLTDEPVEEPPTRFAERWREAALPDDANWTLAHGETRRF
jgi:N-acyl-phosphatidylethanolamine-hydrolysing phospholipase D